MKTYSKLTRWITTGLLAASVLSMASTAFADRGGNSRRWKGVSNAYPTQRVFVREHSSSAGPAIAGLIGGFLLGTAMSSNSHPVIVHEHYYQRPVVEYRYYDPYGDNWYDSLDQCDGGRYRPRVIQVIDVRSGREVRELCYHDGGWRRVSGDYDNNGYYGGDDDD